jgi:serine/threonine-protein kinase HipA
MVLLEAVTFNLLIGNNDAHAKNFSILYLPDGSSRLAPLYDLVCTVFYPEIMNKLAMKIGGEANPELVFPREFDKFATDAGLSPTLVRRRIPEFAHTVLDATTKIKVPGEVAEKVAHMIAERCESMISRFGRN